MLSHCNSRYFYGTNVNICNCTKGFTGHMCEVPLSDYLPDGKWQTCKSKVLKSIKPKRRQDNLLRKEFILIFSLWSLYNVILYSFL